MAKRYDNWINRAFSEQYKIYRSELNSRIQAGDTVLEIGTGTGDIAFNIAAKCKKVIGIDIAPEMIAVARRKKSNLKLKNTTFQVEDAYNLPFKDEAFDKVVCCNALQTMKEPTRAIQEGKRVLKDDGEFISITYCYGSSSIIDLLKLVKWVILYGLPGYWKNFKCEQLAGFFEKAGMEIIEGNKIWKKPVVLLLRCRKKI
ncbi:MAG: methyltransferase domain-containing protein [Thermoplasmata archaeon]|nr:methyltransferase domain-containing protein [Thermoplasmata archaeon]